MSQLLNTINNTIILMEKNSISIYSKNSAKQEYFPITMYWASQEKYSDMGSGFGFIFNCIY